MQKNIRTFIAIEIPKEIKATILTAIKPLHLHPALKNIKWTDPINWHITLCFLGNISQQQLQCINSEIKPAAKAFQSFNVKLTKIEPFPSAQKFNILSLKPQPIAILKNLATVITNNATTCDIQTEKRPFKPHLTLAQIKDQTKICPQITNNIKLPAINFKVTTIKLFKSELKLTRSVYTVMATYKLPQE